MFKEITIKDARDLCRSAGVFAHHSIQDISLSEYPQFYRIQGAYQDASTEDVLNLIAEMKKTASLDIPEGCNCTVVFEAKDCSMDELNAIFSWATNCLGEHRLQRLEPVILFEAPFAARITVLCHSAKNQHYCRSEINCQGRYLLQHDLKVSKTLDAELARNREIGAVTEIRYDTIAEMVRGKHLLWTAISSTTRSASEIINRFKPEMTPILNEYNVNDLVLFIETDKTTTREEVDALRRRFKTIVGKSVHIRVNHRVNDSLIRVITCRAVLVGTSRFETGHVYEDYGQYEILLFESENPEHGHAIAAMYTQEGLFTLCRWDWGAYEYNWRGQTDDGHFFDAENTRKFFEALHARKPETFLRRLLRFTYPVPSSADRKLLDFCDNHNILYTSDYHY